MINRCFECGEWLDDEGDSCLSRYDDEAYFCSSECRDHYDEGDDDDEEEWE